MLNNNDYIHILLLGLINIILIMLGTVIIFSLIYFNNWLGMTIADAMKIPYDLAISITSIGFVNEFVVVLSLFELVIIGLLFNKLNKIKMVNKLFNRFISLF